MTDQNAKVYELMKDTKIAMLTTIDPDGRLVSHPMATQQVEFAGDVWFIAERSSGQVRNITVDPRVNVAYVGKGSWVSLSGEAAVVDDVDRLRELWDTFTDAWMEGGPENPENILIQVTGHSAEYWDSPGSKVVQVANLLKTRLTGKRYDADNEVVDLG